MDINLLAEVLLAKEPRPELKDKLMLFGQLVGAWDVDITNISPDGTASEVKGEWHFGWALEGRAIIDVWIAPRRSLRDAKGSGEYGATLRFFDPAINAWRSTWVGPGRRVVMPFIGRQVGDEIVLEGSFAENKITRWIFSGVTPTHFNWRAVESSDGGETWVKVQEMAAERSKDVTVSGTF